MFYTIKLVVLSLILLVVTGDAAFVLGVAAAIVWLYVRNSFMLLTGK